MMLLGEERRYDGHKCYNFVLSGLTWIFIVSKHAKNLQQKDMMFISKEGVLPVIVENRASKEYFERTFQHMLKSKRFSEETSKQ
jgi:hypothetical protein